MAKTMTMPFTQIAKGSGYLFQTADSTDIKDIVTAGADGSIITSLTCRNEDGAAEVIRFYRWNGSASIPLGDLSVPDTSGELGLVDRYDVLANLKGLKNDKDGNPIIQLGATEKLQASLVVQVSTNDFICLSYEQEDF